jgi:hypothetical protein
MSAMKPFQHSVHVNFRSIEFDYYYTFVIMCTYFPSGIGGGSRGSIHILFHSPNLD